MTDQRLVAAFERLVAAHDAAGTPPRADLRPPVPPERLDQVEDELGFALSECVRTLYGLADGVEVRPYKNGHYVDLTLGNSRHGFVPLHVALADRVKTWKRLRRIRKEQLFSQRWFAVFVSGWPGDLAVSCLTPTSTQTLLGLTVEHDVFRAEHPAVILDAWSQMIESGRWRWGVYDPPYDNLPPDWIDTVHGVDASTEDWDVWLYPNAEHTYRLDPENSPLLPTA